jgi:hypothetical protein
MIKDFRFRSERALIELLEKGNSELYQLVRKQFNPNSVNENQSNSLLHHLLLKYSFNLKLIDKLRLK